jgi:hypothetical protein
VAKYFKQNWKKLLVLFALTAGALAVQSLFVERDPEADLPGIWVANYDDASERLLLYRDRRFVQQISYGHGGRYMANGMWRTAKNNRRWDLVLDDALDPFDSMECILAEQPRGGRRDFPIIRDWPDWSSYQLQQCPQDEKRTLEKIAPVRR